jgi:hypothetical protein
MLAIPQLLDDLPDSYSTIVITLPMSRLMCLRSMCGEVSSRCRQRLLSTTLQHCYPTRRSRVAASSPLQAGLCSLSISYPNVYISTQTTHASCSGLDRISQTPRLCCRGGGCYGSTKLSSRHFNVVSNYQHAAKIIVSQHLCGAE